MFQEYPKMLYKDGQNVIANDAEHEATLRNDGWHDYGQEPKAQAEGQAKPEATKPSRNQPAKPKARAEG